MTTRGLYLLATAALLALALLFVLRAVEYASDGGTLDEVVACCAAAAINVVLAAMAIKAGSP